MTDIVPNTAGYDGIRSDIVALLEVPAAPPRAASMP
jgi:hypothetical protein